jgi:hypothetical protein
MMNVQNAREKEGEEKMLQAQNASYQVTSQRCRQADYGWYTTYGIALVGGENGPSLPDISPRRQFVEQMAALFNRLQLAPVHMRDAVEDMLS